SLAKRYVLPLIDQPERFLAYIQERPSTGYIRKLYQDWLDECAVLQVYRTEKEEFIQAVLDKLYSFAIQAIQGNITLHKHHHSILTFSDLILNMHKALQGQNNERLVAALQKKYKAVF